MMDSLMESTTMGQKAEDTKIALNITVINISIISRFIIQWKIGGESSRSVYEIYFLNSESRLLQMQVEGRGKIQNLMIFPRSLPGRSQLLVTTATGNLKISHSKIKQKLDQSFFRYSFSVNGKPVQLNGGCRIHGRSTENVRDDAVKV